MSYSVDDEIRAAKDDLIGEPDRAWVRDWLVENTPIPEFVLNEMNDWGWAQLEEGWGSEYMLDWEEEVMAAYRARQEVRRAFGG